MPLTHQLRDADLMSQPVRSPSCSRSSPEGHSSAAARPRPTATQRRTVVRPTDRTRHGVAARADLSGGGIRQTIVVPRKLVNIVTQEPV